MASRKAKRRQTVSAAKKPPVVEAPRKPSALALYIVKRQTIFSFASAFLFLICGLSLLRHLPEVELRYSNTPPALEWTFLSLWALSAAYRFNHSRTANPRLKTIVLDDAQVRKYGVRQTVSTLLSLAFSLAATTYLLGYLEPISVWMTKYLPAIDHQTATIAVTAVTSVFTSVFWNVVSSAIWDGIKLLFGRKK